MEETQKKKPFIPFEDEWEKQVMKLPKSELVSIIRNIQTGSKEKSLLSVETSKDASLWVDAILADYDSGRNSRSKTLELFGEYTGRIMSIFYGNCKKRLIENPNFFNETKP